MSDFNRPHPFDEMVRQPESEIRLAHAAFLWARDEYPDLKPPHYLDRLNAIADRVDREHVYSASDKVDALRRVLVEAESFRGNVDDFANPTNSYLNRTIDTRMGIPVTLSAVWLDVAGQLNWPFFGVSLPGHFVIRCKETNDDVLVDPFNGGRELSRDDCVQMMQLLFGADFIIKPEHFAPAGQFSILARMLGNLYANYVNARDWSKTARVLRRLVALRPQEALVRAELGRVEMLGGDFKSAAADLNHALELANGDDEVSTVNHHLIELRSRLTQQN